MRLCAWAGGPGGGGGQRRSPARRQHTHRPPNTPLYPPLHPSIHPQALEFAQSKGNARRDGSTGVTLADVGGLGTALGRMMTIVEV